ncbi:TIGR03842 family LLM class F420-dependent oxidoreductase [Micrococcus luteus]
MDFGVVFQCDPPASTVVELARKAEDAGFDYVWTFDSHLLWQEPFVIYSQILAATQRVIVGPMVTNPGTRDWTVIASQFATLNEMFGNRTICGIGRGDSALRTLGAKPGTIDELKQCVDVVRALARGETVEYRGQQLKFTWVDNGALDVWVAAYGPKALAATGEVGDGYILQLADPDIHISHSVVPSP